jgi:hypothetical protein
MEDTMDEKQFQNALWSLAEVANLNTGEVLKMAREIAADDTIRTIDRLEGWQRELLLAQLRELACVGA